MLSYYGLQDQRDYTIIVTGDPAARTASLRQGKVDALVMIEPRLSQLKAEGFTELVRGGIDVPGLKWPYIHLVTTRSWAKANEDTLVRFLRGWLEGVQYVYDPAHKEEVIKILSTRLKVDEKFIRSAYQNWIVDQQVYSRDGKSSLASLQTAIDGVVELGDIPAPGPKPADLVDFSYVDKTQQR